MYVCCRNSFRSQVDDTLLLRNITVFQIPNWMFLNKTWTDEMKKLQHQYITWKKISCLIETYTEIPAVQHTD